jgi:hypothetical protein
MICQTLAKLKADPVSPAEHDDAADDSPHRRYWEHNGRAAVEPNRSILTHFDRRARSFAVPHNEAPAYALTHQVPFYNPPTRVRLDSE